MFRKSLKYLLVCSAISLATAFLWIGVAEAQSDQVSITNSKTTKRVSVSSDGLQANNISERPSISSDGRYIAFVSSASNLVPNDTNGWPDVFVYDQETGITRRISDAPNGEQGNHWSNTPVISGNGRFVAFDSLATNLVTDDTNGRHDTFVHDLMTGQTARVSVSSNGTQANADSIGLAPTSISYDGRFVTFTSWASNLVESDNDNAIDIFVHDRETGQTTEVSVSSAGVQGNNWSDRSAISGDGRFVAFDSIATNLVTDDTNGSSDVFVYDRQEKTTERVSISSSGVQGNNDSVSPSISFDGRYITFLSNATNLVMDDTYSYSNIFVYDRQESTTELISTSSNGVQGNYPSSSPSITADGRYVAFLSADTNGLRDVFKHDRLANTTQRLFIFPSGQQSDMHLEQASISADGNYVTFTSASSNLVTNDTNGWSDVFVRELEGTNSIAINDEFSLATLNSKWHWVREVPTHWSLVANPGYLRITTTGTDLWQNENTASILLQPYSKNSVDIMTKVIMTPTTAYQQGGLIIYGDDDNYVRLSFGYIGRPAFEFGKEISGVFEPIQIDAPTGSEFYLRLKKSGASVYGYYSLTGNVWTSLGQFSDFNNSISDIGLFAFGSYEDAPQIPVDFDFFRQTNLVEDPTFVIKGKITKPDGTGLVGVNINSTAGSATTVSEGNFTISNIVTGTYVITPTLTGFKFVPRSYTLRIPPSQIDVNFTALPEEMKIPVILVPGTGASMNYACFFVAEVFCHASIPYTPAGWDWTLTADQYYRPLLDRLRQAGYNETNGTLSVFFYDWRKPIQSHGETLNQFIEQVKTKTGSPFVDVIAHSQGGLVTRSYIQNVQNTHNIRVFVAVGTPNQGSPKTYPYWQAGEVYDLFGFPGGDMIVTAAINETYRRPFETQAQAFRRVFPSFKDMLPTYDYLYLDASSVILSEEQMQWRNTFLPNLNADVSKLFRTTGVFAIHGNDVPTTQRFFVTPPNLPDTLLDRWADGVVIWNSPGEIKNNQGDGTVPLESAKLNLAARQYEMTGVGHDKLLTDVQAQQEIFKALRIPWPSGTEVSVSAVEAEETFLFVAISGTVAVEMRDPLGQILNAEQNTIPEAEYIHRSGYPQQMIIVPNQLVGQYSVTVTATQASTYTIGAFSSSSLAEIDNSSISADTVWDVASLSTVPGKAVALIITEQTNIQIPEPTVPTSPTDKVFLPLITR
jgi:pimeloyl-ACP methyl ester carboxylesterase